MPAAQEKSCGTGHGGGCSCGGHGHSHGDGHNGHSGGCGCGHHHAVETPAATEPAGHTCKCQSLRPYRRVHAVLGVVLGLFIVAHLSVLATALAPERFSQNSHALHVLSENLPFVEIIAVLLPAAVLLVCGVYLLYKAGLKYHVNKCNRGGKMRYFLQRLSAAVLLAFLLIHVTVFSQWGLQRFYTSAHAQPVADGAPAPTAMTYDSVVGKMAATLGGTAASPLGVLSLGMYLIAIVAVAYHLANGLWTGAIIWDLCKSDSAKRRWGICCAAIGIIIGAIGIVAWYAFAVAPYFKA